VEPAHSDAPQKPLLQRMQHREEFKVCVQLQGYNLIGIVQKWWDSSHHWSAPMEGYWLFRKDSWAGEEGVFPFM